MSKIKITDITESVCYYVTTDDGVSYRRGKNGAWERAYGYTWELEDDPGRLEEAYQEWLQAQKLPPQPDAAQLSLGIEAVRALSNMAAMHAGIAQFVEGHFNLKLESWAEYRAFLHGGLVDLSYMKVAERGGLFSYARGELAEKAAAAGWTDLVDVYGWLYGRPPGSKSDVKMLYKES